MPRASKAVDAAKQLGRKVAAAGAAKPAPRASAKPTSAPKAPGDEEEASSSSSSASKPAKAAKPAKPAKAAPAGSSAKKSQAGAKPPAAKKVQETGEKSVEKEGREPKPARKLEGASADKFFEEQRALLDEERISYLAQAADLKAEADQLAQEMEPGDIQFDDESGEGATAAVDRERDLALSAQARVEVDEIDHALAKLDGGSYGICEGCGQPIPRARLRALPHARLCVACKSGGLSRR